MTVRELLARTDSHELTEWMAYEKVTGPLGGERGDYHAALVAWVTASSIPGRKGPRPKISDFLPVWDRQPQSWQDQLATVRQINAQLGGTEA